MGGNPFLHIHQHPHLEIPRRSEVWPHQEQDKNGNECLSHALELLCYQHKNPIAQHIIFPIFALYFHPEEYRAFGN